MSELSNERRIPFTQEDEQRIASAATWGMIVSITSIASGGLSLLVQAPIILDNPGLRGLIAAPVLVAVYTLVVNVWLLQASLSFRKVALTDEADQVYLLEGFRKLRAYFMIQVILILAMFGLFGIMMLALMGGFMR
ncbi:MAG: hypothetical protein R3A51_18045 [Nannocystaceae bacterium]|nr:hypothetical protein [Myxococcales bacterium]